MNTQIPANRIEILSVDLLDEFSELVDAIRRRASRLGIQLGWHYSLDLAWIASQFEDPAGMRILDAGGGTGVLQWWLADHGADVVSVDRLDRSDLSGRYRLSYRVSGLRPEDLDPSWRVSWRRLVLREASIRDRLSGATRASLAGVFRPFVPKSPGQVSIYQHDLASMPDLEDESFDAVVSISALEHNDPAELPSVVDELMRVLRPSGTLLATLSASRNDDWYHEPSKGWCLTESTLRNDFRMPADTSTNFHEYDLFFSELRKSQVLQEQLAPMYFESGESGMPWGVWDPQYQPVGLRRKK